ncbi:MAG TPA: leucyl aminopeptidase [Bacteroidales bacterium]|nr:leucyl aminopeptidase [Bacteroidales bacterium]
MQNVRLEKINEIKQHINTLILLDKEASLEVKGLTDEELYYVRKEFDNKSTQIILNRYTEWVIIQTFDKSRKTSQTKEQLRKDGASASRYIRQTKTEDVQIIDYCGNPSFIKAFVEGILLGNYQFNKYLKDPSEKESKLKTIYVLSFDMIQKDWEVLSNVIQAVYYTRDLVNEPPTTLTAVTLSEEFTKLAKDAGLQIEVMDKARIEALRMNGLLAVNRGSIIPPTFTVLTWKPEKAGNSKPIVLVGKGIAYDTGGYSLKPTPDSMDSMKSDMAGAATVASVMYAIAKNNLPVYCMALIPSTDNHIGASAYMPGDIITYSDGTSVEVMNTDAEGRLILADALLYAKQLNPELLITIATLTGSAHKAIGTQGMVGMGNLPEETIQKIIQAGDEEYERIALFPFWDEYKDSLKSEIADLKNIGGGNAGAITAGKFLEHFTDYPYFHLDIAGVAFFSRADNYRLAGGTGIGVRLLYHFLENFSKLR